MSSEALLPARCLREAVASLWEQLVDYSKVGPVFGWQFVMWWTQQFVRPVMCHQIFPLSKSFLQIHPTSKHWSFALCSLLLQFQELLCFSELRILQHQVQSPCGHRKKLQSAKPRLVKSPTSPPPKSRSQATLGRKTETISLPTLPVVAQDGENFILGCTWET